VGQDGIDVLYQSGTCVTVQVAAEPDRHAQVVKHQVGATLCWPRFGTGLGITQLADAGVWIAGLKTIPEQLETLAQRGVADHHDLPGKQRGQLEGNDYEDAGEPAQRPEHHEQRRSQVKEIIKRTGRDGHDQQQQTQSCGGGSQYQGGRPGFPERQYPLPGGQATAELPKTGMVVRTKGPESAQSRQCGRFFRGLSGVISGHAASVLASTPLLYSAYHDLLTALFRFASSRAEWPIIGAA